MNNYLMKQLGNFSGIQFIRFRHTKHWNPKYKAERRAKVIKVPLDELTEDKSTMSKEDRKKKMKERGIYPQKPWLEKPMYVSCTSNILEPYVPPEGDGKFSSLSTGAKQGAELLMKKTKSYRAYKKIKRYEEEFSIKEFANEALDIYVNAHNAIARKDKDELSQFVTETLLAEMLYNLENKTVIWKFVKSLEPTKAVHARCTPVQSDTDIFGQVTVRFHTQQILAVYDRFGRLMNGSEIISKDVLEYIVFEKHLTNMYGRWRLHGKIIPPWMPMRQPITKTFVLDNAV